MYDFDPAYGYSKKQLLSIDYPRPPRDFRKFWRKHYTEAVEVAPKPMIKDTGYDRQGWRIFELSYQSTNNFALGGWLLLPKQGMIERGFVVAHGYGGRDAPDFHLPFKNSAILFPCCRGLGRSIHKSISSDPAWHVLHNLQNPEDYILRGCVQDIWLAVSALLRLFPDLTNHIGYLGISFGGGIGALAAAFDPRIQRCHFNVPSFGSHPLRLKLPTLGSARSVQNFYKNHPESTRKTLRYFDAATAARFIQQPTHVACALYDPCVAPPGQFAIYNALRQQKQLFILTAGHHAYPQQQNEEAELLTELDSFFQDL